VPVTVKHRIGIDKSESYEFVRDFVGTVRRLAGCRRMVMVHAAMPGLKGPVAQGEPHEVASLAALCAVTCTGLKRRVPAST
jgi:tRNA-dihydrouridine synthase A